MPRDRKPTPAENAGRLARKAARVIQKQGWTRHQLQSVETGNVCLIGGVMKAIGIINPNFSQTPEQTAQVNDWARHFVAWLGSPVDDWHRDVVTAWNDGSNSQFIIRGIEVASPHTQQDLLDVLAKFSAELDPRGESDASRNPAVV